MFLEQSVIKYHKSSILEDESLVHAFTTRIGGTTPPPLNTFSLGTAGMNEYKPYVEANRESICKILGLDKSLIINPSQEHTDNIKVVRDLNQDLSSTDGVITDVKGLVLLLLFADCVPIIIYSKKKEIVGVIHAGWRGTAKKIAAKAVKIFINEFNADPEELTAAIGPSIGQCCYPVGNEAAEELAQTITNNHDKIFKKEPEADKIKVDLKEINSEQLKESGVLNIDISPHCTCCLNTLFYSYRADKGITGRQGAIAALK